MNPKYLTTAELAERLRTPESTVRYWRMTGYGPESVKVGRRRLYPITAVELFEQSLVAEAPDRIA